MTRRFGKAFSDRSGFASRVLSQGRPLIILGIVELCCNGEIIIALDDIHRNKRQDR